MEDKTEKRSVKILPVLGEYFQYANKYPFYLWSLIFGVFAIQATNLISPFYLRNFFNLITKKSPDDGLIVSLITTLGMYALFQLVTWVFRQWQFWGSTRLESRVMTNLYDNAFAHLIRHSHEFFISNFTGTLSRRVARFARTFENIFDTIILFGFLPAIIFIIGVVTVLTIQNTILGLGLLVWVIIIISFQLYVAAKRQPLRVARTKEDSAVSGAISDSVSNHSTISSFAGEEYEQKRFNEVINKWRVATVRSWDADFVVIATQGFLMIVINIALLLGALYFWQKGTLTIGDFVLIQTYLLGLFDQLWGLSNQFRRIYDSFAEATEGYEMVHTPYGIKNIPTATALHISAASISFKDVDFNFNETRSIFSHFLLDIAPGEKVALVGPSGAGKSTVTKLLMRLYDVSGGEIEIDGQNIAKVTQESLRESIAFVPQEPVLFHRTLKENIAYGKRDATDEEIIEAAKKAHCHEFIASLPEGYDTYVGERGVKLSGGERQRVAIARAILKNAPILILDEATSSLDSESEALIQDALVTLMQGKTVVVIAHRLSTIMRMDRIIVIEGGKIAAEGTHDELLAQDGLYKKLWSIQAGGFIQE